MSRLHHFQIEADCTLEDVARTLGVTQERVRQIEARALRKLRDGLITRGYCLEDFLVTLGSTHETEKNRTLTNLKP